jgi:peptide/nickel transport system substrate-binding protein
MASTPVRGGRLRIAAEIGSQKETLDPAKRSTTLERLRNCALYDNLVNLTIDLKTTPGLAVSWEANKSADEWIFMLRKGVEWHNGKSLRAEDVIYTIRRVMDKKTGSGGRSFLSDVDPNELRAEDAHTVRVKLAQPNVDFPIVFTSDFLQIVQDGFTDFDNAVGTGPFILKSFKPGRSCLVVRNPNFWRSGLPYVDEVDTFSIPDTIARTNALLAGEIHLLSALDPQMIDKIESTPGVRVLSTPSGYRAPIVMNCTVPPYNDPNVRLALKMVIDREKYIKMIYKAHAVIGNDHPIGPIYPDFCEELPQRDYDPERAKSLLKKAGAENTTFELHVSDLGIGAREGAVVYSQMAAKAGVKIKIVRQPTDGFWNAVWMKKPFLMCAWQMRSTANMVLSLAYKSDSSWNDTFWKRPDFDKLLLEARRTFDLAKRKELYCEMQQMIRDDGGKIIPCFVNMLDAASEKVKGIVLNPIGPLGDCKIPESCWIEE